MLGTDHFRTPEDPAIVAMIVRCGGPSWLVPVGDHVVDMQFGMLELVR